METAWRRTVRRNCSAENGLSFPGFHFAGIVHNLQIGATNAMLRIPTSSSSVQNRAEEDSWKSRPIQAWALLHPSFEVLAWGRLRYYQLPSWLVGRLVGRLR